MTGFDPARTALALARPGRRAPLGPGLAPTTVAEGAAAQFALATLRGEPVPAGFKIGATSKRMQEYLGLPGPAAGYMPASGQHRSGAAVAYGDLTAPGVECELAVRLAHDLPPAPCDPATARAAVGALFAAIEIVENRYGDVGAFGTPALIADQIFHIGAVLGDDHAGWAALDPCALAGSIAIDGARRDGGIGADLLGDPMRALAWLAGSAEVAAFGGLRAGQVVLLGSVTPPVWLDRPAEVVVDFPPLPAVTLRLT